MILAALPGEFPLQEELLARDAARGDRGPNPGFDVVFALVRRIDGAEATCDGLGGQRLRALLLPGRAIHDRGNGHAAHAARLSDWHGAHIAGSRAVGNLFATSLMSDREVL